MRPDRHARLIPCTSSQRQSPFLRPAWTDTRASWSGSLGYWSSSAAPGSLISVRPSLASPREAARASLGRSTSEATSSILWRGCAISSAGAARRVVRDGITPERGAGGRIAKGQEDAMMEPPNLFKGIAMLLAWQPTCSASPSPGTGRGSRSVRLPNGRPSPVTTQPSTGRHPVRGSPSRQRWGGCMGTRPLDWSRPSVHGGGG